MRRRSAPFGPLRTVGVVIPSRDDAHLLARCLRAVAAQTRPPDQIVVVDDGSRDETATLATSFGARVVALAGQGIPAASAAGYDACTGDLICRLDADSVPPPSWIGDVLEAFDLRPELAALSGGAWAVDGSAVRRRVVPQLYLGAYRALLTPALGHTPLFGSALAIRAEAWREVREEVHRDDPVVHDDLDLAYHLGARHPLAFRRDLAVGVASRGMRGRKAMARRILRGFHTVFAHWPEEFPPLRWARRLARRTGAT